MKMETRIVVRPSHERDLDEIVQLQRRLRPSVPAWTASGLRERRERFPEGQLVAESAGRVVGFASALVVQWDDYGPEATFNRITGEGSFATHDREGRTLFVAEALALAGWRHEAVVRALHRALRTLSRASGLRRILAACPIPGYRRVRQVMPPELYAMRVAWCDNADPELSGYLSRGYRYCGIIHNFLPEDVDSCGHAALLAWPDPSYRLAPRRKRPVRRVAAVAPSPPALTR